MEEACSDCKRITKYKCLKCDVSVCAFCAPETAQSVSEANYCPIRHVEVCQKCQQTSEVQEATDDSATVRLTSSPSRSELES